MNNQNSNALVIAKNVIMESRDAFIQVAQEKGLDIKQESVFAIQACMANPLLAETVSNKPNSLKVAMHNLAVTGLTLNPVEKLTFLVVRNGVVVLDISYQGLKMIAERNKVIEYTFVELVYKNDRFAYKGANSPPVFEPDVFSDNRGDFIGSYCQAKLTSEDILVVPMSAKDIYTIRDLSMDYQNNQGPWVYFFEEMVKKVNIKRAFKTWPHGDKDEHLRMSQVIDEINQHEGLREEYLGNRKSSALDVKSVSPETKQRVEVIIERARLAKAWTAAEEYGEERYCGNDLQYFNQKLKEAKEVAENAARVVVNQ